MDAPSMRRPRTGLPKILGRVDWILGLVYYRRCIALRLTHPTWTALDELPFYFNKLFKFFELAKGERLSIEPFWIVR